MQQPKTYRSFLSKYIFNYRTSFDISCSSDDNLLDFRKTLLFDISKVTLSLEWSDEKKTKQTNFSDVAALKGTVMCIIRKTSSVLRKSGFVMNRTVLLKRLTLYRTIRLKWTSNHVQTAIPIFQKIIIWSYFHNGS